MSWRLLGLVLIFVTSALVPRARARELDLTLSRLSQGDCAATLPGMLTLARDGQPVLRPDQDAFRALVSQLSESAAPTSIAPVTTTGPVGFDLALETTLSSLEAGSNALARAFRGDGTPTCMGRHEDVPAQLSGNRVRFEKGLPFGLSLGALAGLIHGSGLYLVGVDAQLALLEEVWGARLPDLALRASLTRLVGADELSMYVSSFELVLSKRFVLWQALGVSPFAGFGVRWTRASARTDLTPNIDAQACASGNDPICNAGGLGASADDYAHDVRFGRVSQLRYRAFAGLRLSISRFSLAGALAFDPVAPRAGDRAQGETLPRQWTLSVAPSVSF